MIKGYKNKSVSDNSYDIKYVKTKDGLSKDLRKKKNRIINKLHDIGRNYPPNKVDEKLNEIEGML